MAFCKVCACGEKIVFARRLSFPDQCPLCGRRLVDFMTCSEDDPRVEDLLKAAAAAAAAPSEPESPAPSDDRKPEGQRYALRLPDGQQIDIVPGGCTIGRTEHGAELLAAFPSVSRQHLKATPRKNLGIIIEDLSTYGTLVDGQRLTKNTPVRVPAGATVTLCDLNTVLIVKEATGE